MTRFGLLVPHFGLEADQDLLVEGARLAESLGFDSLWVRDHLVFHPHGYVIGAGNHLRGRLRVRAVPLPAEGRAAPGGDG